MLTVYAADWKAPQVLHRLGAVAISKWLVLRALRVVRVVVLTALQEGAKSTRVTKSMKMENCCRVAV
jgi:tRNA threonylcarbamoyladenosine modification (KEOPS) complex Cgi121 subunit